MADDTAKSAQSLGALEPGDIKPREDSIGEREGRKVDKKDFFKFTLDEKSDVNIVLDDLAPGQDVDLYLRSANGRRILDKSQAPAGTKEFISAQDLDKGTYIVEVRGKGNAKTDYKLTMRAAPESEGVKDYETEDTSKPIVFGEPEFGEIGVGKRKRRDQKDFYNFELDKRSQVNITLGGISPGRDADVELQSLYADTVVKLDQKGDDPESVSVILDEGKYFLKVVPRTSQPSDYALTVDAVEDIVDTDGTPPGIGLGSLNSGGDSLFVVGDIGITETPRRDKSDWYNFKLEETGDVEIVMDDLDADANFTLWEYNSKKKGKKALEGNLRDVAANNKRTKSETENRFLGAGDYAIEVTTRSNAKTGYALEVNYDAREPEKDTPEFAEDLGLLSETPVERPDSTDENSEPEEIGGRIGQNFRDTEDWYKFTVDGDDQEVGIIIDGMTSKANIYLYEDPNDRHIAKGKKFKEAITNEGQEITYSLDSGEYYIKVEAGSGRTDYTLEAKALGIPGVDTEDVGVLNELPKGRYNAPRGTTIGQDLAGGRNETDIYNFSLSADSSVSVNLGQMNEDARLKILDSDGKVVAESNNPSNKSDFIESKLLPVGDYTVEVGAVGSDDTSYRLNMSAIAAVIEKPVAVGVLGADGFVDRNDVGDSKAGVTNSQDVYQFTLAGASDFELDVVPDGGGEVFARVVDSAGNPFLDYGKGVTRIKGELPAGDYEAQVFAVDTFVTEYLLDMSAEAATTKVTDDTPETAVALTVGDRVDGDVSASSDAMDYYKFSIDGSSEVSARLTGLRANADLKVVSVATGEEWVSDKTGKSSEVIDGTLEAGEYYAVVEAKSGKTDYTLRVEAEAATGDLDGTIEAATDLGAVADPLTNPVEDSINVGKGDASDYYKISASGGEEAIFSLSGLKGNADLLLLDSAGGEIAKSASSGTSDEIIEHTFDAGDYFLQVTGSGSAQTAYTLDLIV
jgi:hypothetical protein